ncbi:MAG TPA: hypothetical protein DCL60_09295 [Armatimonadetes bacterium]|nr:hypothetical protein [Armatimonadota bacterium]
MNDFTLQFKEHARKMGADLVGIAPIERFEGLPKEHHPASIFPEVRSVVIIAKRVARGTLRGIEEGTQFQLYNLYGRDWLNNRFLAMPTYKASEFLEDNGWEAVPLPNLPTQTPPMGIAISPNLPAPNVMLDMDDAAVRAGMGEIGYCGLFLTPEFGPRQRFQAILTDAELTPDPVSTEAICSRCQEHASFCPMGAINSAEARTVSICGKDMLVAGIDNSICNSCKNGAYPNSLHPAGDADRIAALCTRSCIQFLEENGRVKNIFNGKFRKKEPWGIVTEHKSL